MFEDITVWEKEQLTEFIKASLTVPSEKKSHLKILCAVMRDQNKYTLDTR